MIMMNKVLGKNHLIASLLKSDYINQREPLKLPDKVQQAIATCRILAEKRGTHSVTKMNAAGFKYIGDRDIARCEDCELEAFNWAADMDPFTVHSKESPNCSYVRSMKPFSTSTSTDQNAPTRPIPRRIDLASRLNNLFEPDSLQHCRRRTFCEWPHNGTLCRERMVQAGFFSCGTDDRSICLHCNLTCEQWTPHVDNPSEVHKTLSPTCSYVREKLHIAEPPPIINGNISSMTSILLSTLSRPVAQNQSNSTVYIPTTSAPECPVDNSLSISQLIRADTSTENQIDVNKFCCKYLLDHWDPDHDPKIEDNRWFPKWLNAKELYGQQLYVKIRETNRAHQLRVSVIKNANPTQNSRKSLMRNKTIQSIVTYCWRRKLEKNHECSVCYRDLLIVRFIQQQQIDLDKNITVPYTKMKQISEEAISRHLEIHGQDRLISNLFCVVCLTEERHLVFMPCGHLATCVPCGYSLTSCPLCRRPIETLARININVYEARQS